MLVTMITAALAAAAVHAVPPAFDAETGETRWRLRVETADLDLRQEAGAREMLARLEAASVKVCAKQMRSRVSADHHGCRRATLSQAVQRLNAPLVTRALEGRS